MRARSVATRRPESVFRGFAARTQLVDALFAGVLWIALCAFFFGWITGERYDLKGWCVFAGYSALFVPLAWRRTSPVASGAVLTAQHLAQLVMGFELRPPNLVVLFSVYALAAYAPRWAGRAGLFAALAGGAAVVVRDELLLSTSSGSLAVIMVSVLFVGVLVIASWLLGKVVRSRRELWQQLTERNARLEHEQDQERRLAVADERSRIAREMHDIVAHSLSVIVAQADGGAYIAKQDPARARASLATIGRTARDSLAEMRRLLGVLRDEGDPEVAPAPTLSAVDALVEDVRRTGIEVRWETSGTPRPQGLPQGAELAAYRVVQEALTNVMKHAGPRVRVSVRLAWEDHGLMIAVLDDGRGLAADPPQRGNGQGIRGMEERVGLYGGTLAAQPKRGGGFSVHAHIPYANE